MDMKIGGYLAFTPYKEADEKVKSYFLKATEKLMGASHTPLAVACQLINGDVMNYAYFTETKVIYPDAKSYNTLVIIQVTEPEVVSLTEIKPIQLVKGSGGDGSLGGYTVFSAPDSRPFLSDVLKDLLIGVGYTILAVASQVVAGVNYAIFAEAKAITKDAIPYNVIVTLFRDLEGKYNLVHIEQVQVL
jgi:hypothetical protein